MPQRVIVQKIFIALSLFFVAICFADDKQDDSSAFSQVYRILKTNCGACHVENGTAVLAWTLDTVPTKARYSECVGVDSPLQCTTYIKLTETQYPWIVAGKPEESAPYINACVKEESYHIGVSIPEQLDNQDCALMRDWIESGALFKY